MARPPHVCILIALLALPCFTAAQDPSPVLEERTSARLVTVRIRVDPTADAAPGACTDVGLDDLDVRLRSDVLTASEGVALERDRRPAMHTLVIDTSHSAYDRLEVIRRSANSYIGKFRPGLDHGMVLAFDTDSHLASGPTGDTARLTRAVDGLVMGGFTAMNDALVLAAREFEQTDRRPVLILLTDGFDNASFYQNQHVLDALARVPELIVFTIGIDLPVIGGLAPQGNVASRRLLAQIAARTQGRFVELLEGSELEDTYLRIRDMLDAEAILTVPDPLPDAEPGELQVRLDDPYCRVRVYKPRMRDRGADDGWTAMVPPAETDGRTPIAPPKRYFQDGWLVAHLEPQGGCPPIDPLEWPWYADVVPGRLSACALDISMMPGTLFSVYDVSWTMENGWLKLRNRRIESALPDPDELPAHPAELMDGLAAHALAVADDPVEVDSRQHPVKRHGRPHDDHPGLMSGEMILQVRDSLAAALYREPAYRAWAEDRTRSRVDAEIDVLIERYRRIAPELSDDALRGIVVQTEEGRELEARRASPSAADVRSSLYAWLGDISAYDLFRAWEVRRVEQLLAEGPSETDRDRFLDEWHAIRRVLGIPSYSRALAMVHPVRDDETGRIGMWRVILPRPSWFLPRIKSWDRHVEYGRMPLDFVPDEPFGYLVVSDLLRNRTELAERARQQGLHVGEIRYHLTKKGVRRAPERAYRNFRVSVELLPAATDDGGGQLVTAEYAWLGKPGERILQYVRVDDLNSFAGTPPLAGLTSTVTD